MRKLVSRAKSSSSLPGGYAGSVASGSVISQNPPSSFGAFYQPGPPTQMSHPYPNAYPMSNAYSMSNPPPPTHLSEPIRSFSPVPILEYPNLVDFRDPVIVGSYSTSSIQLRLATGSTPWATAKLNFRSIQSEQGMIPADRNPFLIRENSEKFNLAPGQLIQIEIKFQPLQGAKFTAQMEIILNYPDQFNRPISQSHSVNIIGQSIEPIIQIGTGNEIGNEEFIEIRTNTKVPIKNKSNFPIPVIIEIDQGNDSSYDSSMTHHN